jgi:hypothetical protein
MAEPSQVKEITAKLKDGIQGIFESDRYADYLKTMSKFHNYSTNNTLLIHMQRPGATIVAGFQSWQNKFGRFVKRGEKAIKIFAPTPFVIREEKEKLDPDTRRPILDENGLPVIETTEKRLARFKVTSVFDVSQTEGKPLPTLAQDLSGNVEQYEAFMDALRAVSSLPIVIEPLPENQDGVCRYCEKISVREGMSQIQTVSAAIHEMTHAKLHDRSLIVGGDDETTKPKDRRTQEVEAESISYAVCQYFGIETGDNSFGYVASWSRGRELSELNASLDTIRKTAAELIDTIDGRFQELVKERNIVIAVGEAQETLENTADGMTAPSFRETRTVGNTVLMPLLYNDDGNLERTGKRTRMRIEPSIGKYQIYSRERGNERYAYLMTDSGKLIHAGGTYDQLKNLDEDRIDDFFARQRQLVSENLQNPDEWVDYTAAAIANRLGEAEAHNAPIYAVRKEQNERKSGMANREKSNTMENKLHQKFSELFPKIATGEYSYLRLEAGSGMEPLSLEWIDDGKISVMHTYKMNGDLCYDPMIVLKIDNDAKTLTAVEFEQSIPPLYQQIDEDGTGLSVDGNGNQKEIKNLQAQLNEFAVQWLDNISQQGYMPIKAALVIDENVETRITFDADGNPIIPRLEETERTELDLSLPDPTLSAEDRNSYGYTQDDMYPLSAGRALELFDTDHTIYLLYPDNTEAMALDRDEIITFSTDGLCGITYADWERSPVRAAQLAIAANSEGEREAELLYGDGDRFGIYQLKGGDETRDYRFESLENLQKHGLSVSRSNYKLVYADTLYGTIESADEARFTLNEIYDEFNNDPPEDFKGHSVSVSDVIVLKYGNNISTHYVDVTGFEGLTGFLGDEQHEALVVRPIIEKMAENTTYSQVGNTQKQDQADTPKSRPSLMDRVEQGKEKVAQQGQPDTSKSKIREV